MDSCSDPNHNHQPKATVSIEDLFATPKKTSDFQQRDIPSTLKGMQQHRAHNGVQLDGIKRMIELSQESENVGEQLVSSEGLKDLVIAMQTFSQDLKLQVQAFCLLGIVMVQLDVSKRSQSPFVQQAMGTVIAIMQAYAANAGIQAYGCYALAAFCRDSDKNSSFVATKGGIRLIGSALNNHQHDTFLAFNALQALLHLTDRSGRMK
eukprot:TRINITY_DN12305_c0_g1_i1.p1 TRINITY_DN12305_c0_g1~~TRINITY_DN12305_c0_g1_i1.p1  ORF type:complete len:207 (-),score=0.87 TRINITY_DN12305_c0_g1_i1:273-893(-)